MEGAWLLFKLCRPKPQATTVTVHLKLGQIPLLGSYLPVEVLWPKTAVSKLDIAAALKSGCLLLFHRRCLQRPQLQPPGIFVAFCFQALPPKHALCLDFHAEVAGHKICWGL